MFQVTEQDYMINNLERKLQALKYNSRHWHDRRMPLNIHLQQELYAEMTLKNRLEDTEQFLGLFMANLILFLLQGH